MKARVILFAVGAVLGTALDRLHVLGGAVSYAEPGAFGQPLWVPPLFGFAVVGFADLHARLRGALHGEPRTSAQGIARDFVLFAAAYAATAFLPLASWAVAVLLMAAWAARAVMVKESRHRVVHALLCGLIGIAFEAMLVRQGAFTHLRAGFLGTPFWLGPLYMLAAPLIGELDDLLLPAPALALQK